MKKAIYIVGPTASGKTKLAVNLAKRLNTQIIGADSMQIYKNIEIGTAKPTAKELSGVTHHMIDFVEPHEFYTVSDYCRDALKTIEKLHSEGKIPIVCGGTGLYINSLIYKMDFSNANYDKSLRENYQNMDTEELLGILKKIDESSFNRINHNDKKRIIRAIEVFEMSDIPMSEQIGDYKSDLREFDNYLFAIAWDRQQLYKKIEARVDSMLENGLIDEVKTLLGRGITQETPALQFIGYKEVISMLKNEISFDEMRGLIKRNTRRYAKRQWTWFRNLDEKIGINWIEMTNDINMMVDSVMQYIN